MESLVTPPIHRVLTSPLGGLLDNAVFERLKTRSLRREFAVQRARAAADVALAEGPAAYLRTVGAPPAPHLHDRIETALATYAPRRDAALRATERWESLFWTDADDGSLQDRLEAERTRRRTEHHRRDVGDCFGFLVDDHLVPSVDYDVPDPEETLSRHRAVLADPATAFAVPTRPSRVQRSAWVLGPGTVEYWVRFPSPSPYVGDDALARVYEPRDAPDTLPTLVYYGGLGMVNDCATYWPEEAALGRALADGGVRVVLPDAPWHGRRESLGRFSGEPYLARAPESTFQLFAAAASEAGEFLRWAREEGSASVVLAGLSLGGIVTMHVAGRCGGWPSASTPDAVVAVAATGDVDAVLVEGSLTPVLGLDDALGAAGWYPHVLDLDALLNVPTSPGLDPARVFTIVGTEDRIVPPHTLTGTLDAWDVPDANRTAWDTGHFGALLRLIRGELSPVLERAFETAEGRTPNVSASTVA